MGVYACMFLKKDPAPVFVQGFKVSVELPSPGRGLRGKRQEVLKSPAASLTPVRKGPCNQKTRQHNFGALTSWPVLVFKHVQGGIVSWLAGVPSSPSCAS